MDHEVAHSNAKQHSTGVLFILYDFSRGNLNLLVYFWGANIYKEQKE